MADMTPPRHFSDNWHRALTLVERHHLMQQEDNGIDDKDSHECSRRWRSQAPFDNDAVFAERLASGGVTESQFAALLNYPAQVSNLDCSDQPLWLLELDEAYSRPLSLDRVNRALQKWRLLPNAGFLKIAEPLLSEGCKRFRSELKELFHTWETVPFEPETIEQTLLDNVLRRLQWMLGRTLALELHVAKLRGLLAGETPRTRFESFVRLLDQPERSLRLLDEYPVLARQLVLCSRQWVTTSLEFLSRLCADLNAISKTFAGEGDIGMLTRVRTDAGDRHQNGRSVAVAEFRVAEPTRVPCLLTLAPPVVRIELNELSRSRLKLLSRSEEASKRS